MNEEEVRELAENVQLLRDLSREPGWSVYQDYLISLQGTHTRTILGGSLDTIERYRYEIGFLAGLQAAARALATLERQLGILQGRPEDLATLAMATGALS